MNRKERRAAARLGQAAGAGGTTQHLFVLAARAHEAGDFAEAERLYRSVLALRPNHAQSLANLGLLALQSQRPETALDWFERALAANERMPDWHYHRALAAHMLGRLDLAQRHYARAIALRPHHAEALSNLGNVLLQQGRAAEAQAHYERALALDATPAESHAGLGHALVAQGRLAEALAAFDRANARNPHVGAPDYAALRAAALRLLNEPLARTPAAQATALALVKAHPVLGRLIAQADAAWPRRLGSEVLLAPAVVAAIAQDPLLGHLLESGPVCDPAIERFLTGLRAALLREAEADVPDSSPAVLAAAAALAGQCFVNEYVYALEAGEAERADALRARLAAQAAAQQPLPPLWLAVCAAYAPLHTLMAAAELRARAWPPELARLIVQQIAEPEEEARLRDAIPVLTPIADDTSRAVQAQYERNPYPRWVRALPVAQPSRLDAYLAARFARAGYQPPAGSGTGAVDILVAGCGTGQNAIDIARQFPGARILAIDLSRTSLAYAARKTRELGLSGIDYAQADILALGARARAFDLIVAMGVLHHLRDPFAGWRALLACLKPRGVMNLGLYSATARREIAAARERIAAAGLSPSPEAIRAFRQEVLALDPDSPLRALAALGDFYAMSDCRDLLFHVAEHPVTLPQIGAFLQSEGLRFLGFDLEPPSLAAYATAHPEDAAMTDLARWAAFEQERPRTFLGMYQVWVQRRD